MERTSGRNLEYLGLGYSTTIKQYEHDRYINSDYFKGLRAGATSQSKRREEARLLRETELQADAEDLALAVQRRPYLDSKVVKFEEMKAVVDSGSTVSLSDLAGGTVLYDYEPDAAIRVQAFNSSTSRGKGRGTIVGWGTDVNGVRVPFRVPRVHRLEGNTINLLSVSSLAAMGNEFHFTRQRSWMKTPDGHEIDFEHKGGLYWLRWQRAIDPFADSGQAMHTAEASTQALQWQHTQPLLPFETYICSHELRLARSKTQSYDTCANATCETCCSARERHRAVPLSLLHRRLGHWNEPLIVKMAKTGAIDVNLGSKSSCVCDVCRLSKPTRRPVGKTREHPSVIETPFERVWTDIKGPVTPDFEGNRYICTFTCEVTRWTCVYFMKSKSEVKHRYEQFLTWVKLQGYKVKQLMSDGGGEYTASENASIMSEFQQISIKNGITQNFTSAYTPEMNGVSERLNRVLLEHGRALLTDAGLSPLFWSLAVKHVVYLRNRLWHKHHQQGPNIGASPYQALYGTVPHMNMLRVWGCDAFKLDPLYKSSTFGRKAQKMIFVGMSTNRKGWVLFDTRARKLTTTFHASFDEDMTNRRCALRDFDLRQHKAGPGATRDEERLALLERELYIDDQSTHDGGTQQREAYMDQQHKSQRRVRFDLEDSPILPHQDGAQVPQQGQPQMGGSDQRDDSSSTSSPNLAQREVKIPLRRAGVGKVQDLDDEDLAFLRMALEINLPCEVQQRNPKREKSDSRKRYEKYKYGDTLKQIKDLGATWEDILWDFTRGYITFDKAAESNALIEQLVEEWLDEAKRPVLPAARVNSRGKITASSPFKSFEESIQEDYAHMAIEQIEKLSYREQRLLQRAIGRETLEEFAHSCAARIMVNEPMTVKEAMASEHAEEWKAAMEEEIKTLMSWNCFEVVPRDEAKRLGGKLMKSRWIFKIKYEPTGEIQRFKARLVACGYSQRPGEDFAETYSPVFGYTSLRAVLAFAAANDFELTAHDMKNAFIQQDIDVEHLYMGCPDGFAKTLPNGQPAALRLRKSIYGLRQSSHLLAERLSKYLKKLGFKQLVSDQGLFVRGEGRDKEIVCTWVDDLLFVSARENIAARKKFDEDLRKEFAMSPWTEGECNWLLSMEIKRDWKKGILHLSQPQAVKKLAKKFECDGIEGRRPHLPMSPTLKLKKPAAENIVPASKFDYASAVGGLLYLSITARPDIAQSVGVLSRYMSCPSEEACSAARQVIRYLYATKEYGITYTRDSGGSPHITAYTHARKNKIAVDDPFDDNTLIGTYCDADLAGDEDTRKSTSGLVIMMHGGAICWSSRLQPTVALSTAEAETIAGVEAVKQVMHLRLLLRELGVEQRGPSTIYEDNNAAISLAHGKEQSKRAKHYQLKVHFLNEQYKRGIFAYEKVETKKMLADTMTKSLPRDDFCRYRDWMGVKQPPA